MRWFILLALLTCFQSAIAVNSRVTFQGSLQDGGQPANGPYDFQFQLQTAAGIDIGGVQSFNNTQVANGVFSVELDLGSSMTSADFQLRIGVRSSMLGGGFTILSPPTPIRPAPQAQVADVAMSAMTVENSSINSLSIVNGSITSVDVNQSQIQLRVLGSCPEGRAIRSISQIGAVTCLEVDTSVNDLQDQLNDQLDNLTALNAQMTIALNSYILGKTAPVGLGNNLTLNGKTGLEAADERCRTTFLTTPSAHLCTLPEIQRALANSAYATHSIDLTESWIVVDVFTSAHPNSTRLNNCGSLLTSATDQATGTTITLYLNRQIQSGQPFGNSYEIRSGRACSLTLPVLCCR